MNKYVLYYNKANCSIGIMPIRKIQRLLARIPETQEVVKYGDCNYVSSNLDALKKVANDIKNEWIQDLEKKIQDIQKIKI